VNSLQAGAAVSMPQRTASLVHTLLNAKFAEVPLRAGELGRALLFTRVPEWAEAEPHEAKPSDQRMGCAPAPLPLSLLNKDVSPAGMHQCIPAVSSPSPDGILNCSLPQRTILLLGCAFL